MGAADRAITAEAVDLARLVEASELFTPADIEFAARKAAQTAFERALSDGADSPATTDDFVAAAEAVRPTLTQTMVRDFEEDIERFARI